MRTKSKPRTKLQSLHFEGLVSRLAATHAELANHAVAAANLALVARNWMVGRHIIEFEQRGADRAEYGERLLGRLSQALAARDVPGFSETSLKLYRQFYLAYPRKGQTLSDQSRGKFVLSWSHYVFLLQMGDPTERRFYEIEATKQRWSLRELRRQFDTSLYERLALSRSPRKAKQLSRKGQVIQSARDAIKEPYVLEFLGLGEKKNYSENDLESAIIDRLEDFLLELGKGFLFEARQKRISFGEEHYHVDLVFYNRLLQSYVLFDLKMGKLTHQDLGQMQMYVNYFDRHVKAPHENPTVGILLCKTKHEGLVQMTLPQKNHTIFASRYQLYLPSKKELRKQLE